MSRITVTGPKSHLRAVIDELHDLELLHVDEYDGDLETGDPFEEAENLSDLLVDIRSVLSRFPEEEFEPEDTSFEIKDLWEEVDKVEDRVEVIEESRKDLESRIEELRRKKDFFTGLKGTGLEVQDLRGTRELEVFVGVFKDEEFLEEENGFQVFKGKDYSVVFFREDETGEKLDKVSEKSVEVPDTDYRGDVSEYCKVLEKEIEELGKEIRGLEKELEKISEKKGKKLRDAEKYLSERVEKSEAPLKFGVMDRSFVIEGWVPADQTDVLEKNLDDVTDGKVNVEKQEPENPPVKQDNNRLVETFEPLTNLISTPKYGEVDPSIFLLLTFPLFFGFMISDMGYGISTAIVFLAGVKIFPKASYLFKALLWTSATTFIFGALYGEIFGFHVLHTPFTKTHLWTEIFNISVLIGVVHVNLGLLLGAYNEYVRHGLREAVLEKLSWILLEFGVLAGYFAWTSYGAGPGSLVLAGIVLPSLIMIFLGEGVAGVLEVPSLLSNILSYLRIFGVTMAAYTMAATVNSIASPVIASGTLLGITGGVLILLLGHVLLTFLKIMEGAIQGIRLHYVEMFGWFYEGGGKRYQPFGTKS